MRTISITAISAAHEVASTMAGALGTTHEDRLRLLFATGDDPASGTVINPGREYCELRFPDCATVTIEGPSLRYGDTVREATVSFSSASSNPTLEAAKRSATVIAFATQVADRLNAWIATGELVVTERGVEVAA